MSDQPKCHCGSLGWTVEKYGRVTHKEACPARSEPWSQTYPATDPDNAEHPYRPSPELVYHYVRPSGERAG